VIRDAIYDLVARNRYRWFGRRDACILPNSFVAIMNRLETAGRWRLAFVSTIFRISFVCAQARIEAE
jgi:hypothetical protein